MFLVQNFYIESLCIAILSIVVVCIVYAYLYYRDEKELKDKQRRLSELVEEMRAEQAKIEQMSEYAKVVKEINREFKGVKNFK